MYEEELGIEYEQAGLRESVFKVLLNIFSNHELQTKYDLEKNSPKELRVCKGYVYESIKLLEQKGFIEKKIQGETRIHLPKMVYTLTHRGCCLAIRKSIDNKSLPFDCLKAIGNWAQLDPVILGRIDYFKEHLGIEMTKSFLRNSYSKTRDNHNIELYRQAAIGDYLFKIWKEVDRILAINLAEECSRTPSFERILANVTAEEYASISSDRHLFGEEQYLQLKGTLIKVEKERKKILVSEQMFFELMRNVKDHRLDLEGSYSLSEFAIVWDQLWPKLKAKYNDERSLKHPEYSKLDLCIMYYAYYRDIWALRVLDDFETFVNFLVSDEQLKSYAKNAFNLHKQRALQQVRLSEFLLGRLSHSG